MKRTAKKKIIIIFVICAAVILGMFLYIIFRYQNTSPERLPGKYSQVIPQVHSMTDKDGDGIDDQADILQSALDYIAAKPKYKSKYYQTGYPDDGYGVCTDVVAFALKGAGYDLMPLVDEDIRADQVSYNIEQPDKNIDFRRVRNLKVYFEHRAISLTTDLSEIEEWQGGDIVIFQDHIGIVSDRRNENGVPYVIHHNSPWQTKYEQDILEKRNDLVGHYRISQ